MTTQSKQSNNRLTVLRALRARVSAYPHTNGVFLCIELGVMATKYLIHQRYDLAAQCHSLRKEIHAGVSEYGGDTLETWLAHQLGDKEAYEDYFHWRERNNIMLQARLAWIDRLIANEEELK